MGVKVGSNNFGKLGQGSFRAMGTGELLRPASFPRRTHGGRVYESPTRIPTDKCIGQIIAKWPPSIHVTAAVFSRSIARHSEAESFRRLSPGRSALSAFGRMSDWRYDETAGGANNLKLSEARENFHRVGAIEERLREHTRSPMPSERPAKTNWPR